jgi:hypothetical protein
MPMLLLGGMSIRSSEILSLALPRDWPWVISNDVTGIERFRVCCF